MRHQAALGRKASLLEDIGIGVAVFAATAVVVFGIGLWTRYVSGMLFVIATAVLAWHSGFRPAIVSTAAQHDRDRAAHHRARRRRGAINLQVRTLSIALVSGVVSWLCGNLYRSRERLLIEQSRLA